MQIIKHGERPITYDAAHKSRLRKSRSRAAPKRKVLAEAWAPDEQVQWYFVKWTNLSYKFCSWEKAEDIASDDFAIARSEVADAAPKARQIFLDQMISCAVSTSDRKFSWERTAIEAERSSSGPLVY